MNKILQTLIATGISLQSAFATLPSEFSPQTSIPISADEGHTAVTETSSDRNKRMEWWRDAKFGMFVHYGIYSGLAGVWKGRPGGAEWIQKNVEVDTDEYAAEALPLFNPAPGLTDEWIKLATEAGCQYAVLTSKHHDGFALFDSAHSDYDSKDKKNRDIVAEFLASCRKAGLKTGLYHSVIDWHHPSYDNNICRDLCYPANQERMLKEKGIPRNHAAYQKFLHSQVKELLTKYGTLDILWWDYSQGDLSGKKGWEAPALIEMCRKINPNIIMNNRLYAYSGLNQNQAGTLDLRCGDFITPEKFIPKNGYPGVDWESCITITDKWGYNRFDTRVKSSNMLILRLAECVTKGGNMLVNINPMANGQVPPKVAEALRGVGPWVENNAEGIFNTRAFINAGTGHPASINRKGDIFVFISSAITEEDQYKGLPILAPDATINVPAGYSKATLLMSQTELSIIDGKVLFDASAHKQTPCAVIKLSK